MFTKVKIEIETPDGKRAAYVFDRVSKVETRASNASATLDWNGLVSMEAPMNIRFDLLDIQPGPSIDDGFWAIWNAAGKKDRQDER